MFAQRADRKLFQGDDVHACPPAAALPAARRRIKQARPACRNEAASATIAKMLLCPQISRMPTSSDSAESDDPSSPASRDRPPRPSVLLSATVERFGGGAATKHRVRDLSPGGVRIDQAADLREGATVLVTVGALQAIGATVIWVRDGTAGLKFAHAIDPNDAKAKVAVAARPAAVPADNAPKAGWTHDLRNPYTNER
jgi:hypothetical protein